MAGSPSGGKGWLGRRGRSFARIGRALRSFFPMLGDVLTGRYRPVPWRAIGCMTAAVAYLLSPLDLIPDVFLVLGLADDALIVGWLLSRVDRHLAPYHAWRAGRDD
ncbi:YkvA family protein [Halomonas sp. I5-271120]|uniref:YkvA family protein n=1 Tax=Halomonas sp. I5-271120 TaxID=3061632 RepID=UPI0027150BF9|nr:YkvA family protein [Halomonas sp. I5-271120]